MSKKKKPYKQVGELLDKALEDGAKAGKRSKSEKELAEDIAKEAKESEVKFKDLGPKWDPIMEEAKKGKVVDRSPSEKELADFYYKKGDLLEGREKQLPKKGGRGAKGRSAEPASKEFLARKKKHYDLLKKEGYTDEQISEAVKHGARLTAKGDQQIPPRMPIEEYLYRKMSKGSKGSEDPALPKAERAAQTTDTIDTPNVFGKLAQQRGRDIGRKAMADRSAAQKGKMQSDLSLANARRVLKERADAKPTPEQIKLAEDTLSGKLGRPTGQQVSDAQYIKKLATSRGTTKASGEEAPTQFGAPLRTEDMTPTVKASVEKTQKMRAQKVPEEKIQTQVIEEMKDAGASPEDIDKYMQWTQYTLGAGAGILGGAAAAKMMTDDETEKVDEEFVDTEGQKKAALDRLRKEPSELPDLSTPEGKEEVLQEVRTEGLDLSALRQDLPKQEDFGLGPDVEDINTEKDLRLALIAHTTAMNKLAEEYREEKAAIAKRRKWEKIVEGVAQIAASLYGLKAGLPIGQIDFASTDWGQEYARAQGDHRLRTAEARDRYGISKDIAAAKSQDYTRNLSRNQQLFQNAMATAQAENKMIATLEQLVQGRQRLDLQERSVAADELYKAGKIKAETLEATGVDLKMYNQLNDKMYEITKAAMRSEIGDTERGQAVNDMKKKARLIRRMSGSYLPDQFWPDTTDISRSDVEKLTRDAYAWDYIVDAQIRASNGDPWSVADRKKAEKSLLGRGDIDKVLDVMSGKLAEGSGD